MKNILITGAAGFVGKSLFERLNSKYNLFALKRTDLNLLDENEVNKFFAKNRVDVVFHCANQGGSRITSYDVANNDVVMNNMKMFFNLERNSHSDMKLISFGSGAQYNKQRDLIKVSESEIGEITPNDSYGFSKLVQHKFIEKSENIISPIIFGLFGKNEDYRFKFISNAIVKNLLKLPIVINQNVIFDYIYIEDFLNIMALLVENNYDMKSFNITPTESIDLISICEVINSISDFKSEIIVKNGGLNFQYTGDNQLMLKNIGDYKFMTYEESIRNLYNYFKSIISTINYNEIASDDYIKFCKVK